MAAPRQTTLRTPRSLLVAKYELVSTLRRRSFWVMALLFPAVVIVFSVMSQFVAGRSADRGTGAVGPQSAAVGYVDEASLIKHLPAGVDPSWVTPLSDESAARRALAAGEIARYYVIPPGAVDGGDLVRVERQFQPLSALDADPLIRYIIVANLFDDQERALVYQDPTPDPELVSLAGAATGAEAEKQGQPNPLVAYAVAFVMFFVITTTGGFMLQSVSREKESRTAEILLLSISPRQIMSGKLLGLTAVALVQIGFWAGAITLALDQARATLDLVIPRGIPAATYVAGLLFFLLGYLLYSSALGALGALAPTSREAGQFTMVILLPLSAPLFLNAVIMMAPNSAVAVAMSIFPLTAPVAMAARMVIVTVPTWQVVVGLAGLAAATYFFVALSARFFRADTLLSGASMSLKRVREGFGRRRVGSS